MKLLTDCKICRKPVVVTIDDAYSELGDPYKLIPMATHDRCHDIYTRGQVLYEAFAKVCMNLEIALIHNPLHDREQYRNAVERLTKGYARWVALNNKSDEDGWSEELVDRILQKPGRWDVVLEQFRKERKIVELNKQRELPVVASPHNDP